MTIEGLDDLLIEVEEGKLSAIRFRGDESAQIIPGQADPVLQKTVQWLDAYFAGKRPKNEVRDEISATPFQKKCGARRARSRTEPHGRMSSWPLIWA